MHLIQPLLASMIMAAVAAASAQSTVPQANPSPTLSPQALTQLVADLSHEDFKIREAARRRLDSIPASQRDLLQKLARDAQDPEVKSSLQERVDRLDEQLALNPPPISLDITDAPLSTTIAALNRALGDSPLAMPLEASRMNDDPQVHFTLHVQNLLFWEVVARLHAQHPLTISNSVNGMSFGLASEKSTIHIFQPLAPAATDGSSGFALHVQDPMRIAAGPPLPGVQIKFWYAILADPRMRISQSRGPDFTQILDSAGKVPLSFRSIDMELVSSLATPRKNIASWNLAINLPAEPGAKLASATADSRFLIQVRDQTLEIDSPETHLTQDFRIGTSTITLQQFTRADHEIDLQFKIVRDEPPVKPGQLPTPRSANVLQAILYDAAGASLWSSSLWPGNHPVKIATPPNPRGPFKLVFLAPDRIKEVTVPFELKDIAFP